MSEVQIHVPSYNEINQASWNLFCTAKLGQWFDSWALGYTHGGELCEDPTSLTVLYFADEEGRPVDMNGKVMNMDGIESLLNLNPLADVFYIPPVPFIIRPPEEETKVKYLKEKRWINGESYIYYSPLQPGQKLKEGQEVVERKVANPLFPHQQTTGKFQTKF